MNRLFFNEKPGVVVGLMIVSCRTRGLESSLEKVEDKQTLSFENKKVSVEPYDNGSIVTWDGYSLVPMDAFQWVNETRRDA